MSLSYMFVHFFCTALRFEHLSKVDIARYKYSLLLLLLLFSGFKTALIS